MSQAAWNRIACCAALVVVLLDSLSPLFAWHRDFLEWNSGTLGLLGLVSVITLRNGDASCLRLTTAPLQGWRYWFRKAVGFGLLLGIALAICTVFAWCFRWKISLPHVGLKFLPQYLLFMCVYAPVVKEVLYRSLLAVALETTFGEAGTIVAGGILFAVVHIIRGNPGPDNQLAGFMLMWAFLRSGTMLVPLAMHAAGNFIAVLAHISADFWQPWLAL